MRIAFLVKDNLEIEQTSFWDVWSKYLNKKNEFVEFCCAESHCEYMYFGGYSVEDDFYNIDECHKHHKLNVNLMSSEGFFRMKIAEGVSFAEAFLEEYLFYERMVYAHQKICSHGVIQAFFSKEDADKFVSEMKNKS